MEREQTVRHPRGEQEFFSFAQIVDESQAVLTNGLNTKLNNVKHYLYTVP